jgi:PhnB protein
MVKLSPYLNFNGRCREAMAFYQKCLGGELNMQPISESPMAAQLPSETAANILHSTLTTENFTLVGSDMMGVAVVPGNAITLLLNCTNEDEIELVFEKLSTDGKVSMPLHQTFWGAKYGELTDRFGMNWMFNLSKS